MKRNLRWSLVFSVLAAGGLVVAYEQRSFGGMLLGLSPILIAASVLFKRLRSVLTVTISLVVAVALAEFVLGLGQQELVQLQLDADYWSRNDLGTVPSPGRHKARKETAAGEVVYDVVYTIGDDSFRVTPGANSSRPLRVNFLGCSVTFGDGLNDDQTLPAYVNQKLSNVQVKNFGIHGFGMHQVLAILESKRDTSGQVNFLLTAPWHAERSACIPSFALGSPKFRLQTDGSVERDGVCGGIAYYPLARVLSFSRVYSLIKVALQPPQDVQIDLYLALIQRIGELSKIRHQQLIIGFVKAEENWFAGRYNNELIVQRLKGMNVEVIDVTLADKAEATAAKYILSRFDTHPTAAANEARATLVADAIRRGS